MSQKTNIENLNSILETVKVLPDANEEDKTLIIDLFGSRLYYFTENYELTRGPSGIHVEEKVLGGIIFYTGESDMPPSFSGNYRIFTLNDWTFVVFLESGGSASVPRGGSEPA